MTRSDRSHKLPEMQGGPFHYAIAVFALALLFAGSARWQAGGPSLPLDDPFIYLQYARQTAHGEIFRYNDGDPPTQGCTSPILALLLVPGFWLGLDRLELIPILLAIGGLGLWASAVLVHRLAERWFGRPWGGWAGALLLLSGPVVWGSFSGMEIPVVIAGLLWLLDRADRVLAGEPALRLVAPAIVVALLRPEGYLAVALLTLVLLVRGRSSDAGDPVLAAETALEFDRAPAPAVASRSSPAPALAMSLALLAGLAPALLFAVTGGGFIANGIVAKSRWTAEPLFVPAALRDTLESAIEIMKGIFGGSLGHRTSFKLVAYDMNARAAFFAPMALALFVIGMAPAAAGELRRRAPGRATVICGWMLLWIVATAALSEPDAHFNRYQQPVMPLFLIGVVAGVVRAGRWIGGEGGLRLAHGLAGYLALFGLASIGVFAVHYGDNSSDIRLMQMTMARVIDERLPKDAMVAINDAGVLRYLGGRRTVDLIGLTTPGMARLWRMGSGSLIEEMASWPSSLRPTHFAIFPNWFRLDDCGLLRPLHDVALESPSIVDAEKRLYAADWSVFDKSEAPCSGVVSDDYEIVDRVDIADRESERAHGYHAWPRERDLAFPTFVVGRRCPGDSLELVADGGRVTTGGERMRVRVRPGREVAVIVRSAASYHARVRWNGVPVSEPVIGRGEEGLGGRWGEAVIARIPAALVVRKDADLEIEADTRDGARHPVSACHYWIAQPR